MIKRIYTTKKAGYDKPAKKLLSDLKQVLSIDAKALEQYIRYDIEGLDESFMDTAINSILSELPLDKVLFDELPEKKGFSTITVEYQPGQYDQRADSAMQCIQMLTMQEKPLIKCATVYRIKGVDAEQLLIIKSYIINAVECREAKKEIPTSLAQKYHEPKEVETIENFINFSEQEIADYFHSQSFAMTLKDLIFVKNYFMKEKRNPTITELRVIDTYWSDHCRHTTFLTELTDINIDTNNIHLENAAELYNKLYIELNGEREDKYKCLMDIATIAAKKLKKTGELDNLDISDEINACSVEVEVDNNGEIEDWLIMFKNETHNHPTEIEPFGGASTCLGGAIRDPLSGRTYVYQAMRITGAGDPNEAFSDTLKGKLPQRFITTSAAKGHSSYGNQIGIAAGIANEIYHDRYKAKRMEAGYVIGGAPKSNIVRNKPKSGDIILLIGGPTGRDGCGGATGSSKEQTEDSLYECGAEVQKGNPLVERNLQRLFRNPVASQLIIKCNDFGAGGISVAVGELADSLDIFLDNVPTKYEGLDGTELAISESQERMAVVINKNNVEKFVELCNEENINAVEIAEVTQTGRMRMIHHNKAIVDIKREFLDTNGVKQDARAMVIDKSISVFSDHNKEMIKLYNTNIKQAILKSLANLNITSQKGMIEMFDSTVGAASVFLPLGGKHQLTPSIVMASKPPVSGETNTATVSSFGCPIDLLEISPFKGAIYSVVLSINKLIASGVGASTIRLTFQEFFKKLRDEPERWGEVTSAMLGALYAQSNLGIAAIGGKDSMSGSFNELDVPPTLISFAMGIGKADTLINNVFKKGQKLFRINLKRDENFVPDFKYLKKIYNILNINIEKGNIEAATIAENDIMSALIKSLIGDCCGISFAQVDIDMFMPAYGDFIVAVKDINELNIEDTTYLGIVDDTGTVKGMDFEISNEEITEAYTTKLENVFPTTAKADRTVNNFDYIVKESYKCKALAAKPKIFIPAFPGTNGEYDIAKRFRIAGGDANVAVVRNRSINDIKETMDAFAKAIKQSQIIAFPGGMSGGGEPDGSGKFIATMFRNPLLADAVYEMMEKNDGLILGLGDGFQGLIRLGLLPHSKIELQTENSPTLTLNNINRHISTISRIRVSSNLSPWLNATEVGAVYNVPVSSAEGRFVASPSELLKLVENGQIATQYVDLDDNATMLSPYNPSGSTLAIEGITSPDGRIFGKMGHSERIGTNLYKNIDGEFDMKIFESGIRYFE